MEARIEGERGREKDGEKERERERQASQQDKPVLDILLLPA